MSMLGWVQRLHRRANLLRVATGVGGLERLGDLEAQSCHVR